MENYVTKPSPLNGKRTSCWRLFNKYYKVTVKLQHFNIIQNRFNQPTTQITVHRAIGIDPEVLERQLNNRQHNTMMTPVKLTEFVKAGFPITFHNLSDAREIYLDIMEHFENWINYGSGDFMHIEPPPINDFLQLDMLAERIFTLSKNIGNYMAKENIGVNALDQFLKNRGYAQQNTVRDRHISLMPKLIMTFKS